MLTDRQCELIETALTEDAEPRKLAAYLCLHMGLSTSEASALRLGDVDLDAKTLTVRQGLVRADAEEAADAPFALMPVERERTLPIPSHVLALLRANLSLYRDEGCYLVSGDSEQPKAHALQNLLFSINTRLGLTDKLTVNVLRDVFTRRCFQCGIDLYTVGEILGLKQVNALQRKFSDALPYYPEQLERLARYAKDYEPQSLPGDSPRRMNLLILGAGSQGPVVKEIAQAIGMFNEIAYLDDDPHNKLAIGPLSEYMELVEQYPTAIPSFGDPALRAQWFGRLRAAGYIVPRLIHPSCTISSSGVVLGDGIVAEPKVIISSGVTVQNDVILSAGCVLDKECVIGAHAHIGCACTITKGSVVPASSQVQAGTVYSSQDERIAGA